MMAKKPDKDHPAPAPAPAAPADPNAGSGTPAQQTGGGTTTTAGNPPAADGFNAPTVFANADMSVKNLDFADPDD
jgi:hypothetical protein